MIMHPDDWEQDQAPRRTRCTGCGVLFGGHSPNCWAQRASRAAEEARKEREAKKEATK